MTYVSHKLVVAARGEQKCTRDDTDILRRARRDWMVMFFQETRNIIAMPAPEETH